MEYEEHIKETIKILREAILNPNEDRSEEIRERIKLYISDEKFGKFLMNHQQLAQDLLDALYNYIKIRHIELEEMLKSSLIKVFAPPSINKLIYLAAMQNFLTFYGFPNVISFTAESLKSAIEWVKQRRKPIRTVKVGSKSIKLQDEYLGNILEKKRIINDTKVILLNEINKSGGSKLNDVLKKNGRHRSLYEFKFRLMALIDLAVRDKVKLLYDKNSNLFIERIDDSDETGE